MLNKTLICADNLKDDTIIRIECGINLTEKPKKMRNLGDDYKGHWNDKSHDYVLVTSDNFLNHLKLYFFYIVIAYLFDGTDNGTL